MFLVAIATVIAEIFGGPPHFFSNSKVGYFYTGPFIGGIIGFIAGTRCICCCHLTYFFSWTHVRLDMPSYDKDQSWNL